ncbi:MAG: hypothetical protein PVH77_08135 [Phycisphaerales bacterium]
MIGQDEPLTFEAIKKPRNRIYNDPHDHLAKQQRSWCRLQLAFARKHGGEAEHLLGEVYLAEGDKVKARKQLKKAVACRKEILDPNVEESQKLLEGLG